MYDVLYNPTEPEGFIVLVRNFDSYDIATTAPFINATVWCIYGGLNFDVSCKSFGFEDIYLAVNCSRGRCHGFGFLESD